MTDVTFRVAEAPTAETVEVQPTDSKEPKTQTDTKAEPAFTIYESVNNGRTYIEEYFGVEDRFNESNDVDGRKLKEINDYFKELAEKGEIENSTEAVKTLLEKFKSKIEDWKEEDRLIVKVNKLLAYIELKKKIDEINENNRIYGTK